MNWRLVPGHEFPSWARRWHNLNEDGPRSPALDPRCVSALIDAFGDDRIHLAVYGPPEAPRAFVVLSQQSRFVWRVFQPDFAPHALLVAAPDLDTADLLLNLVYALPGRPQVLVAADMDPDLASRPAAHPRVRVFDHYLTRRVSMTGDFDAYWRARTGKFRANTRRRRSLLGQQNITPVLKLVREADAMRGLVADHARLEAKGWKGGAGTAIRTDDASGRFYERIMCEFAATGDAVGARYLYNDAVVATYLGIRKGETEIALKWAYDESHSKTSPGTQLRYDLFRKMFEEGKVKTFEFYGAGPWQRDWSDEARMMYQVYNYRSSVAVRVHRAWQMARQRVRRWAGRSDAVSTANAA